MRILRRLGVLLAVGFLGLAPGLVGVGTAYAKGATYFVAVNGPDTTGNCSTNSARNAFPRIAQALSCAEADTARGSATVTSPDTIHIAAGTYDELLAINADVNLVGVAGTTIVDGTRSGTVVSVNAGYSVGISDLTIQNGSTFGDGGGIANRGTLTLTSSIVRGNSAHFGSGGGILNTGTLRLSNSTVSGNSAESGGGIANGGALTLSNSTVKGNTAYLYVGGGITNGGTLTLDDSSVVENIGNVGGGGIYNTRTATLANSAVKGNTALYLGGGIANYGTLSLSDSAVMENYVGGPAPLGSGIYNDDVGTLTLTNSTVSKNSPTSNQCYDCPAN